MNKALSAEKGATMMEYALVVGVIALVVLVAMPFIGNSTFSSLRNISSNMDAVSADLHQP